jgi:hypothetical protein
MYRCHLLSPFHGSDDKIREMKDVRFSKKEIIGRPRCSPPKQAHDPRREKKLAMKEVGGREWYCYSAVLKIEETQEIRVFMINVAQTVDQAPDVLSDAAFPAEKRLNVDRDFHGDTMFELCI